MSNARAQRILGHIHPEQETGDQGQDLSTETTASWGGLPRSGKSRLSELSTPKIKSQKSLLTRIAAPLSYSRAESLPQFDPRALALSFKPDFRKEREKIRSAIATNPVFSKRWGNMKLSEHRAHADEQLKALFDLRILKLTDIRDNYPLYQAFHEEISGIDGSVHVKLGVQFTLFGGAILLLGTERHAHLYKGVETMTLPGCFAMTELRHGSNVKALETTATYIPETQEFEIHTPSDTAQKIWIGGATNATAAVIFAQLIVGGVNHGVHTLYADIRDSSGQLVSGVRVADAGWKMGLNGINNGRLWFDHFRVPRVNLLNKYGGVDEKGVYTSPIANPVRRFAKALGALVGGRVTISSNMSGVARVPLANAIKYALYRRQFGPDGKAEVPIMTFTTHQTRLIPLLARNYALLSATRYLGKVFSEFLRHPTDVLEKEVHSFAAGMKALSTWFVSEATVTARECCGGVGFSGFAGFGNVMADTEIYKTFEGDNTVLLQQVSATLLSEFSRQLRSAKWNGLLEFMANTATAKVRGTLANRLVNEYHLRDVTFQRHALEYREAVLLRGLAGDMLNVKKKRVDPFDGWNSVLPKVVRLAWAHMERAIFIHFVNHIELAPEAARPALGHLRSIYALSIFAKDPFWAAHRYFSSSKLNAIHSQIQSLCAEVLPSVEDLVDALDTPASFLSELAQVDGDLKHFAYATRNDSNNDELDWVGKA